MVPAAHTCYSMGTFLRCRLALRVHHRLFLLKKLPGGVVSLGLALYPNFMRCFGRFCAAIDDVAPDENLGATMLHGMHLVSAHDQMPNTIHERE